MVCVPVSVPMDEIKSRCAVTQFNDEFRRDTSPGAQVTGHVCDRSNFPDGAPGRVVYGCIQFPAGGTMPLLIYRVTREL